VEKIQIVTDSTGYISKAYADEHHIQVLPLSVHLSGETMEEGYPGEFEDFFRRLSSSEDFPKTSQPSVESFVEVFEEAVRQGKEVIAIVISSKLSGTYNSASAAARMVDPEKIRVIDSQTSVSNLRFLVEKAHKLAQSGMPSQEIARHIEAARDRMGIRLTVDTLEYLRRGGRLSGAQAYIGNILNIKPVIGLVDGALVSISKTRGKNKAIELIMADIPREVERISICHIMNGEEARSIQSILQERFPTAAISIDDIGPVIGSHLGPRAIGICYMW
jgi:DegV family protein with EDD domain